jgi:hypothetical protein
MRINGREVIFIGDWYIRISVCARTYRTSITSVSVGQWFLNSKKLPYLLKACKRIKYENGNEQAKEAAIKEATEFIKGKRA